ncbi:hypothetical protein EDC65_4083 [Stella humosa]|uniref:PD-(D/E)XK nuclease superfamily protein n=1 Tax=Stella humosa TaxID=94 RepID=A0A3N1KZ28_9PROT|nr:hypothetical protein [Stella humosa]ROP83436.1 hypothetical protein EDC65_4083 [Stella humosa]BBK33292.1 hypothetical protein STHU_39260 [Stella humosa]
MTLALNPVLERDLDVVLAAALHCSTALRNWLIKTVGREPGGHSLEKIAVSAATELGETDVLVIVALGSGEQLALMIEHKIGAVFQSTQAERYALRGDRGRELGGWHHFETILCAPSFYLDTCRSEKKWGTYLAFEEIEAWARQSADPTISFLPTVYEQATRKLMSGRVVANAEASQFWQRYREAAATILPAGTKIAGLGTVAGINTPWPRFQFAAGSPAMRLEHKPRHGVVDLNYPGVTGEQLATMLDAPLPTDVRVERTGQSWSLRINVPTIDHLKPFETQEGAFLAALAAVERLHTIERTLKSAIAAT